MARTKRTSDYLSEDYDEDFRERVSRGHVNLDYYPDGMIDPVWGTDSKKDAKKRDRRAQRRLKHKEIEEHEED